MGEVYLAQFEALPGVRKLAAVKVLPEVGSDPTHHRALLREAQLAALLSHPNVVQMLDAGLEDGTPWLAMEFVGGVSLQELLAACDDRGERLPPWVVARIGADAALGLHAVHEAKDEVGKPLNVVHRDVSPHNVLVTWDGIVKIADFGIARSTLHHTMTVSDAVKGKLAFMAPEQATGGTVERRADVFALGVVLWEALAGRRLFKGASEAETFAAVMRCEVPPLASVVPGVDVGLATAVERALGQEPSARHTTALDFARALEAAMRAASVEVGPNEVAAVMAQLLPLRVREHEGWLREAGTVERSETVVAGGAGEPTEFAGTDSALAALRNTRHGPHMSTKLHGMLGAVRWIEETHGAAELAVVLAACSPKVNERLATGIGINWHPASEYVELLIAAEARFGDASGTVAEQIGAASARRNTRGTLMRVLSMVSRPAFLMGRVASLWRQFNDQGQMKLVEVGEGSLQIEVVGVPEPVWLHCCTITGWAREMVAAFEPKDLAAEHTECRSRGAARCLWHVRWGNLDR